MKSHAKVFRSGINTGKIGTKRIRAKRLRKKEDRMRLYYGLTAVCAATMLAGCVPIVEPVPGEGPVMTAPATTVFTYERIEMGPSGRPRAVPMNPPPQPTVNRPGVNRHAAPAPHPQNPAAGRHNAGQRGERPQGIAHRNPQQQASRPQGGPQQAGQGAPGNRPGQSASRPGQQQHQRPNENGNRRDDHRNDRDGMMPGRR